MAYKGDEDQVLRWLLAMPLLDGRELAAVTGLPRTTLFRVVGSLTGAGFLTGFRAAVPGAPKSARLYLTGLGLAIMASEDNLTVEALLRRYPASAHSLQVLLARIETVAAVYRIARGLSETSPIRRFTWYRALALDAGVELEDGRIVGIIREGGAASPLHLTRRLGPLARRQHPGCILVLAPDRVWVRESQRRLSRLPFKAFLAVERDVLVRGPGAVQWAASFDPKPFRLAEVARQSAGGRLPEELAYPRLTVPPVDLEELIQKMRAGRDIGPAHEYLLHVALQGGEKRLLDAVALWPLATLSDLSGLLGMTKTKVVGYLRLPLALGLVEKLRFHRRNRFVLSERGLAHLARRDRMSADRLIRQWSPRAKEATGPGGPLNVRGSALGDLARHPRHTAAVYGFWAELSRQVRAVGGELVTLQPPHLSQRRYAAIGHVRTLKPDGYAQYRFNGEDRHFFLEWEQRAGHPVQFRTKLQPYLSYYQGRKPMDDHGAYPVLLVVLRDEVVMAHFLRAAAEGAAARGVRTLQILASDQASLRVKGPLAAIWHTGPGRATRLLDAPGPAP